MGWGCTAMPPSAVRSHPALPDRRSEPVGGITVRASNRRAAPSSPEAGRRGGAARSHPAGSGAATRGSGAANSLARGRYALAAVLLAGWV